MTMKVDYVAAASRPKVVYLPRTARPWSTDDEAVNFMKELFEAKPAQKIIEAIRTLKLEAQKQGWRVGSDKTLYRIANKIR